MFRRCVLILGICALLAGCGAGEVVDEITGIGALEQKLESDKDLAIIRAKAEFNKQISEGIDMSSGPCLSNEIVPGWVADVAHQPRQPIDNDPLNQCSSYREGKAKHFVELDEYGNLIRAK